MKPDIIKQLLPAIGSSYVGVRTGWLLATCPMHWNHVGESANFGISTDPKKKSRCKCFSCGYSGDLVDLLLDIKHGLKLHPTYSGRYNMSIAGAIVDAELADLEVSFEDIPDFEEPAKPSETVFPESWLGSFKSVLMFEDAVAYLKGRGVKKETMVDLEVKYDPIRRRVGFPFRNMKKQLMGMQGRAISPDETQRYYQYGYKGNRNGHVLMNEDKIDFDQPLVIVEGPLDLCSVYQLYPNVVATFTSGIARRKLLRIADASEIVTLFDFGTGGNTARASIRKYLPKYPTLDIIPTAAENDANAMPRDTLFNYLSEAGLDVCP